MSKLNKLGIKGEQLAEIFLKNNGFQVLFKNFRFQHKEIDIIFLDKDIVVFCEIKTRSSYLNGYPEDAVTKTKQKHIKWVADYFLMQHPQYTKVRFDIVSIILVGDKAKEIFHIKDAFY